MTENDFVCGVHVEEKKDTSSLLTFDSYGAERIFDWLFFESTQKATAANMYRMARNFCEPKVLPFQVGKATPTLW